jgi:putative inorganic carbon (HCO3(-)) transporter
MHIAGAGWWGWEAYIDPERDAGRLLNVGSSDTLNDNQAAGHLLTVLPFVMLFAFFVKDKRLRGLAIVAAPLVVNTFILCNSRGAMVGMVVALVCTLFLAKKGHRRRMVYAAAAVVFMFFMLADQQFITRQQSTINYEQESTAQNRISNWGAGLELLKDHPFGTGGYGFNHLSPIYAANTAGERSTGRISPHNTLILISSEWGIQGFIIFVGFIGATFKMLHRVRRETADQATYYRSLAIQIGLIGTLAASVFSDRLYGESIYWLCALAVVSYRIHQNSAQTHAEAAQPAPSGFRTAEAGAA